ncbi:unnamed protein product, partial [Prorocentrum cordatum]
MPVSALASAARAFVSALLALARAYGLKAGANRDSEPEDLLKAHRRLLLNTHPDKGGKKGNLQKLQAAKEKWEKARKAGAAAGRPRPAGETTLVTPAQARRKRKEFRVQALVVLLAYHSITGMAQWRGFVTSVKLALKKWGVRKWGAALEARETGRLRARLALEFSETVDRAARSFAFEGPAPHVSPRDYLGEGVGE